MERLRDLEAENARLRAERDSLREALTGMVTVPDVMAGQDPRQRRTTRQVMAGGVTALILPLAWLARRMKRAGRHPVACAAAVTGLAAAAGAVFLAGSALPAENPAWTPGHATTPLPHPGTTRVGVSTPRPLRGPGRAGRKPGQRRVGPARPSGGGVGRDTSAPTARASSPAQSTSMSVSPRPSPSTASARTPAPSPSPTPSSSRHHRCLNLQPAICLKI